jgi:hypothetical protein
VIAGYVSLLHVSSVLGDVHGCSLLCHGGGSIQERWWLTVVVYSSEIVGGEGDDFGCDLHELRWEGFETSNNNGFLCFRWVKVQIKMVVVMEPIEGV